MIINSYAFAATSSGLQSAILARNPLGYWRLNETTGTTMNDSSGNARHGTFAGNYTLNQSSITPTDASPCIGCGATGSGTSLSVPDAAWMDPSALGLLAVIRPTAVNAFQHLLNKDDGGTDGYWLRINSNARVEATFRTAAGVRTAVSTNTLAAGVSYIIEAGYDGANIAVYVNGSLWASLSNAASALSTNARDFQIGRNGGSLFKYSGLVQHVAMFNAAPTAPLAAATATAAGL